MKRLLFCLIILIFSFSSVYGKTAPGIDVLLEDENISKIKGKKIGLVCNQTAITSKNQLTLDILKKKGQIVKIFAPEHGVRGEGWAGESIQHTEDPGGIPILSLHGKNRRPTAEMLKGLDLIIYDMQDIGSRSYTFATTLFYVMEEAAKHKIKVMVLDRPNPINGVMIDGPMLEDQFRSFVGYINVPYCHGMTIGELAKFFNGEYKVGCDLEVIPMKGWKRKMTFRATGLTWIPTSPNIPEAETPQFYPMTGIIGELGIVSTGVGYTLPFKVIGATWIQAERLTDHLNRLKLPGVSFTPTYFRPFAGKREGECCPGTLIHVTNPLTFKPVTTQFAIIDALKKLYPSLLTNTLKESKTLSMFNKVNGTDKIYKIISTKGQWLLDYKMNTPERHHFEEARKKYLIYD